MESEQLPAPERALFLLDLAPGEGYLAEVLLPAPVVSYTAVSPFLSCDADRNGGFYSTNCQPEITVERLFSVALS